MSSSSPVTNDFTDEKSCELLGPTALIVQAVLGVLVLLSLVYKRHREPRKRPWRIWLFDVSKQVVGQMFVHGANVLLSDMVSQYTTANACVFYFLHILLDTTLGVAALYLILHGLTHVFSKKLQCSGFESGVYGNPPSFNFWARQAALYVMSLTTMKLLVILVLIFVPGILQIGEWLLRWTRGGDDYLFITFLNGSVMGIFPIIMNVLQFWLIDSIVKASGNSYVELNDNSSESELYVTQDCEPLFRAPEDEDEDYYRPSDIENGRARQSSSPPSYDVRDKPFITGSTEYNNHYPATTSEQHADHSYPPSLSSSMSSTQGAAPRRANNLGKHRRGAAPAPLTIHNPRTPAINSHSPRMSPGRDALPQVPTVPLVAPIPRTPLLLHPSDGDDAWAETWEDSEEWVDDRDEKSQGIERTNDARGGTSTIRVDS